MDASLCSASSNASFANRYCRPCARGAGAQRRRRPAADAGRLGEGPGGGAGGEDVGRTGLPDVVGLPERRPGAGATLRAAGCGARDGRGGGGNALLDGALGAHRGRVRAAAGARGPRGRVRNARLRRASAAVGFGARARRGSPRGGVRKEGRDARVGAVGAGAARARGVSPARTD